MRRFGVAGVDLFQVWSKLLRTMFQDLKALGFVLPDPRAKTRLIGTCGWSV